MRSSTSNSNCGTAIWGIKALLVVFTLVTLLLELGARYVLPAANWNMRRFHSECAAAMAVGANPTSQHGSLLFLGNSLSWTDVDLSVFRDGLGATNEICRWAIDDTNYLDWYFALRRAFRSGARPKLIIIGARGGHIIAQHVRGRFFAHYILDAEDITSAAKRTGVDATGLNNLLLAKVSSFYGSREEIFKRWLTLVIPSFPEFGRRMAGRGRKQSDSGGKTERLMVERFRELKELASVNGSRVLVWIPPTADPDPLRALMIRAGEHVGIPVVSLDSPGEWSIDDFMDRYHMTPPAAKRFSRMLLEALTPLLLTQSESR